MIKDAINDEILAIKRSLAAAFDNDLDRIVDDLRSRQVNPIRLPREKSPRPPINPTSQQNGNVQ